MEVLVMDRGNLDALGEVADGIVGDSLEDVG